MRNVVLVAVAFLVLVAAFFFYPNLQHSLSPTGLTPLIQQEDERQENSGGLIKQAHPLSIEYMRKQEYPGSDVMIEQTLPDGSNYHRYIASYKSDGLKIYALLTIPNGNRPPTGWPVIIFNHGYIAPVQYRTTERYIAYTDAFSRNGYILFRPDYRGHGNSEGSASGGYGSNDYTIDVLNAVSSIKKLKDPNSSEQVTPATGSIVDVERIGMWGHSMGGHITLRNMVVSKDIKAGVIWAGVVASYPDLLNNWRRRNTIPRPTIPGSRPGWRQTFIEQYGEPLSNTLFWNSISATSYLADISGPVQLHHGTADTSVPVEFSQKLHEELQAAGKTSEIYVYPGDDHNINANFDSAITRSVQFFDKYVKGS